MFVYHLEKKDFDRDFLARKPIRCSAVVSLDVLDQLEAGCRIVIQLSSRSKYMGVIQRSEFEKKGDHAEGYLLIIRP